MRRTTTWATLAVLSLGTASIVGCQSNAANDARLPPGEDGSRAGGNGSFGSGVEQPNDSVRGATNGTGTNTGGSTGNR